MYGSMIHEETKNYQGEHEAGRLVKNYRFINKFVK